MHTWIIDLEIVSHTCSLHIYFVDLNTEVGAKLVQFISCGGVNNFNLDVVLGTSYGIYEQGESCGKLYVLDIVDVNTAGFMPEHRARRI